jgi:hypothetical protein
MSLSQLNKEMLAKMHRKDKIFFLKVSNLQFYCIWMPFLRAAMSAALSEGSSREAPPPPPLPSVRTLRLNQYSLVHCPFLSSPADWQ